MPIQSSSYVADVFDQIDGRVWITETHVDSVAGPLMFAYLAADTTNATAVMNDRAVQLEDQLAEAEFEVLINGT